MARHTLSSRDPQAGSDQEALSRMISYLEAECRRLGAADAALHLALAATLLPAAPSLSRDLAPAGAGRLLQ
ncbi:hypothetical protein [Roseomonas sp. KE0001]|uniref:hypothetical protein n=1 Tax=unclassified Roseomonas TaxID=2617492 RepID=UPI0018E027FC|nr:hypothetical protein [Roseomonas sp. KE0001]